MNAKTPPTVEQVIVQLMVEAVDRRSTARALYVRARSGAELTERERSMVRNFDSDATLIEQAVELLRRVSPLR